MKFLILSTLLAVASAQFYHNNIIPNTLEYQNPPPVDPASLVHQEVAANAARESQLPPELLNPFYKDPRIATGLAKESWLANKEFPVFHRDTQDIPREAILKIFRSAGFSSRVKRHVLFY